jgi:Zn-dependent peptidase ImmA (M78 family)
MILSKSVDLRKRLTASTGLDKSAIEAAWPDWWTDEAESSVSAQAELRFSLARKLGLDPTSLLNEEEPRWLWDDSAKFKGFRGDNDRDKPAINSFGSSIGRLLLQATPEGQGLVGQTAKSIRDAILKNTHSVQLLDLISLLWGVGIPVIHLRVYPLSAKRMCAMAVRVGGRYAILLARDSSHPSPTAFHLAHEIGHIVLGHLSESGSIVDMEDPGSASGEKDDEEFAADAFALELLTGKPVLQVLPVANSYTAAALAQSARQAANFAHIEPGVLVLCFGYSTGRWDIANKALQDIYPEPMPVWQSINHVAERQLRWPELTEDSLCYMRAILGGAQNVDRDS